MNRSMYRILSILLLTGLTASQLWSQFEYRSSWILAQEGRKQKAFAGVKVLAGVDVSFNNLGVMPYIENENVTYPFNDGDFLHVPYPDGDFTTQFQFQFANATEGADGNVDTVTMSRFRAGGDGEDYKSNLDFSVGWELGSHYDVWRLSNKLSMGFTVAGGFTPLNADYETTISGELYRQTVTVPLNGPGIPYQDSGVYNGSPLGGPYILLDDILFDPNTEERVTQVLADGTVSLVDSEVEGIYTLNGGMGTFRVGTYFEYYLTEKLLIHLGLGLSASYVSFEFEVDQSLISSTLSSVYQVTSTINEGEWLLGAYAELNLVYRMNQKTSIYAGAQSHFIEDFKARKVDETIFDVRMGSPTQFQTGFELEF